LQEAANDGKYVIIENTHRSKEEDIGEWKLKRRLDSKKDLVFTFPKDFILKPGKTVKVRNN
jgi:intermediate filament protein if